MQRHGLLTQPQRGPDDAVNPAPRRWFHPLGTAPVQQLFTHPVRAAFGVGDVFRQPPRQPLRIGDAALPVAQMPADLGAVILNRAARPLVKAQVPGRHLHLTGHEVHRLLRQLRAAARKPTRPRIKLQQQRKTQPRRTTLAGHQLLLILQHRPVLDELIHFHRRPSHPAILPPRRYPPSAISPQEAGHVVWGW
jgi:hypothetical protein